MRPAATSSKRARPGRMGSPAARSNGTHRTHILENTQREHAQNTHAGARTCAWKKCLNKTRARGGLPAASAEVQPAGRSALEPRSNLAADPAVHSPSPSISAAYSSNLAHTKKVPTRSKKQACPANAPLSQRLTP